MRGRQKEKEKATEDKGRDRSEGVTPEGGME